jgi:hypothetical protein
LVLQLLVVEVVPEAVPILIALQEVVVVLVVLVLSL